MLHALHGAGQSPYLWPVLLSRLCRDRTGRYLRDNSVRRGAYPGLGPPGPCSFLSHVDIPPPIVQLFVFSNSKHRSANQSRAHPTVTNLTWRDSILPLDASNSNLRTIELFRVICCLRRYIMSRKIGCPDPVFGQIQNTRQRIQPSFTGHGVFSK